MFNHLIDLIVFFLLVLSLIFLLIYIVGLLLHFFIPKLTPLRFYLLSIYFSLFSITMYTSSTSPFHPNLHSLLISYSASALPNFPIYLNIFVIVVVVIACDVLFCYLFYAIIKFFELFFIYGCFVILSL